MDPYNTNRPVQGIPVQPVQPYYTPNQQMAQVQMPGRQDFIVIEHVNKGPHFAQGDLPQRFYCDTCQREQVSKTYHKMGTGSWICCAGWCIFFFPFALFPCCCNKCKDTVHYCPGCKREVGRERYLV